MFRGVSCWNSGRCSYTLWRYDQQRNNISELDPELRDKVQRFVTAVSLVELDDDGVPCRPDQEYEWDYLTGKAHYLVSVLRSPADTALGTVRTLAREWTCVIAAFQTSGATESNRRIMGRRWLAARAQVADLLGPGPGASNDAPGAVTPNLLESFRGDVDGTHDDGPPAPERNFEELPIDSPPAAAMVAADPDLGHFMWMAARGIRSE